MNVKFNNIKSGHLFVVEKTVPTWSIIVKNGVYKLSDMASFVLIAKIKFLLQKCWTFGFKN